MKERGIRVIFIYLLIFLFLVLSSKLIKSEISQQQYPCSCNNNVGCYDRSDLCTSCGSSGPFQVCHVGCSASSEEDVVYNFECFSLAPYDFSRSIYFGGLQTKSCGCNNTRCGEITPIEARDICINSTTLRESYFEEVSKTIGYDYELRTQYINCEYGCVNYSFNQQTFGKCNPEPLRAAPQYVKNNSQIVFFQRINKYNFTPYNEYYTIYLSTNLNYEYYGLNTSQGIFSPFSNWNLWNCSILQQTSGFFFNLFDNGNYNNYKDLANNDGIYSGKTRINDTSSFRSIVVNEVIRSGPSSCRIYYPGSCITEEQECRDEICYSSWFKLNSNITVFIDNKPPEISLTINNGANTTSSNILQLNLNYNENYPYKCRFSLQNFSQRFYNNSGDANGDSFITWEDADLINTPGLLNQTQNLSADINNDGVVNSTDMSIVVNIILNNYNQTYPVPQANWQACPSGNITLTNQSPGVINVYGQMVDRSLNINTTNKTILFLPKPQFNLISPTIGSWQRQNFNVTWNVTYANNCSYRLKVNGIYRNWTPVNCNASIQISVGNSGDCNVQGNNTNTCGVEINASYTQNGYVTSNNTYYYFGIDYTSPSNTIISPIHEGIYNSTNPLPYLNGTAFDNISGIDPYSNPVRLYLYNRTHHYNGSQWITNLSDFTAAYWPNTWSVSAPSFGINSAYYLAVTVFDRALNLNGTGVLFYYANSDMIPYINIIFPQNNTWQRDPNVTLSIQDTSASSCWYKLSNNGGASWQNYSRTCNTALVVTIGQSSMCNNEGVGKCILDLYANSSIGIVTSKRMVFNIDYNPPSITNIYPANGSQIYGGVMEITGLAYTSANNTGYPLNTSSIKVKLSNGTYCYNFTNDDWSSTCSFFQVDYYNSTTGAFGISIAQGKTPEGKYNITINATDALNHTTIIISNFSIVPGPSVSIISPDEFSWHNKTFNVTMIDTNADNCSYQINNGSGYGVKSSRPCNQNLLIGVGVGKNCSEEGYAKCAVRLFARNNSLGVEANITKNYSIDFNYPFAEIITPQNNSRLPELKIINGTANDTAYPLSIQNIQLQLKNNSNNKCFNFSSRVWSECAWYPVDSYLSGVWQSNATNIILPDDQNSVYTVILNVTDIVSQSRVVSSTFSILGYPKIRVLSPEEHSWHNDNFVMNILDDNAVTCYYSISNGGSDWSSMRLRNCSNPILITVSNSEADCTVEGYDECGIKLTAIDEFGRNSSLIIFYSIDYTSPSATISNPMNLSIINSISMFNGTLYDSYSGISSVVATISDSRMYYYDELLNVFRPFLSYLYPSFEVYKTNYGPWIGGWGYSTEKVPFTEGAYLLNLTAIDNANNSYTTSSLFFIDLSPSTCEIVNIEEDSKYVYVKSLDEVYYSSSGIGGFSINVSASESLSNVSQIIFPNIFNLNDGASYSINGMSGSAQHSYFFDRVVIPSAQHTIFCENDVGLRASDSFLLYHDNIAPFVSVEGKLNPPTQIKFVCIDYGDNPSGCDGKVWHIFTQELECPSFNDTIYSSSDIGDNINIYSEGRICYYVFDNVGNEAKGFVRVANKSTVIINPKEGQQVCGGDNGLLIEAIIPEEADFVMFYDNNYNFINTTPQELGYTSVYLPNSIAEANGGVNDSLHIIKVESYSGYANELLSEDSVKVIWDCVPPLVVIDRGTLNDNQLISGIKEIKTEVLPNDTTSVFFSIKKELNEEWQLGYGAVTNLTDGKIFTLIWDTRTINDGVYQYIKGTAIDDMGLIGTDIVKNITIDNTPPAITDFSPEQGAILWGNTTKLSFNATDTLSGINVSSARISFDSKNWIEMNCDIISENSVYCPIEWLTEYLIDGYYLVTFSIKDIAGNEAERQVLYKFVKNPLVMLIKPLSNTIISKNFTMEAISVPETKFVEFAYKKVSEEFWNVIIAATDNNPDDGWKYVYNLSQYLPDGYYDFRVTAYDLLGATIGSDISINVTNDNENPIVNVSSPTHPNQNEWYNSSQVIIEWYGVDNYSGIYGFSYLLDRNESTIPDDVPEGELGAFEKHNTTTYLLNDGEYWFHIKAIDNAGNIGETRHFRIRVDLVNEPPKIEILKPIGITLSKTPEIAIKTNKACECTFNQTSPNITAYYNKTLAFSTSDNKIHTAKLILPEGEQRFVYSCTDFRGENVIQEHMFIIDPDAKPDKLLIVTDTENGVYYAGQTISLEVNATKEISGFDYPLDGLEDDLAAIIDGGRVTTHSTGLGEGKYIMSFKAPLNTTIQHSVSAYARTVYSPLKYFTLRNQSLTIEYLKGGSLISPNIVYVQEQKYIIGLASEEPAEINTDPNKIWIKADPLTANMFIFLTLPYANLDEKSLLLSLKEFFNQVRPSFGLGKRDIQSLSTEVDYPNIKIKGSGSVGPGRYTLIVRNAGRSDDGKIILEVEII